MPYLEKLMVGNNRLSDAGVHAVVRCLLSLPKLATLDLSMNEIGKESATALRSYLANEDSSLEVHCLSVVDCIVILGARAFYLNKLTWTTTNAVT